MLVVRKRVSFTGQSVQLNTRVIQRRGAENAKFRRGHASTVSANLLVSATARARKLVKSTKYQYRVWEFEIHRRSFSGWQELLRMP